MADITKCGWVRSVRENPQGYSDDLRRSVYFSLPAPTKARCLEHARKLLEEALAKDTALHEANAPIIESNKAHRAAIEAAMTAAGVEREFAERIPNRSRMGHKTVRSTAGYIADMARCLPIDDAFADAVARYNATKAAHDRFEAEAKQEEEQAKRKAEFDAKQAAEKRKADIELATIILRYEFDHDSDWDFALDKLRERDQRLDLAVAMEQTRGDWSEGYYRVRDALGRFRMVTDEDKAIVLDIMDCLKTEHDDRDGRVFRDTDWNYDRLYESVEDKQLSADVRLAAQRSKS